MKHLLKVPIALLVVMALTGSAGAAACKTVKPQDLEGHIQATLPGNESVTVTYFQQNGCDWAGNEQLNGFDGVVFDVASMAGTKGSLAGEAGPATLIGVTLDSVFLDSSCTAIDGTEVLQAPDGHAYALAIPKNAAWLAVGTNSEIYASGDLTLKLHSNGKKCKKKKG